LKMLFNTPHPPPASAGAGSVGHLLPQGEKAILARFFRRLNVELINYQFDNLGPVW